MLYMVVEQYTQGPGPIYRRAAEHGRMLPAGLHYVDSWVVGDDNLDRCFQLTHWACIGRLLRQLKLGMGCLNLGRG